MKYKEIDQIPNCPPKNSKSLTQTAYRFVFEPIDLESFKPQGFKKPARVANASKPDKKCSLMALSMYTSRQAAISAYEYFANNVPKIKNTIGTHLAEGLISDQDGLQTEPDETSHFDFFEKDGSDIKNKFKIIEQL